MKICREEMAKGESRSAEACMYVTRVTPTTIYKRKERESAVMETEARYEV